MFHHTCIQDESAALKLLVFLFPDSIIVTVIDREGNSPLVQALRHGSVDGATILLELDNLGDIVGQGGWIGGKIRTRAIAPLYGIRSFTEALNALP